jgi:hypothetical protein
MLMMRPHAALDHVPRHGLQGEQRARDVDVEDRW